MRKICTIGPFVAATAGMLAGCVGTPLIGQQPPIEQTGYTGFEHAQARSDLADLTCWDATMMGELDQELTLTLIYGYARGTTGRSVVSSNGILAASDATMERCAGEPDATILQVMRAKMSDENRVW